MVAKSVTLCKQFWVIPLDIVVILSKKSHIWNESLHKNFNIIFQKVRKIRILQEKT